MSTREIYTCGKEKRLDAVRAAGLLNGIEYVEVSNSQTTITIAFLKTVPATITQSSFEIVGGSRIQNIAITGAVRAGSTVTLTVAAPGDFSFYQLQLRDGVGYPVGFDPQLCDLTFSFKVNCPSALDCQPDHECAPLASEEPPLDYLAKDFQSFRRLMIERLTLTNPGWKQHSLADQQTVFVELLAYVADYLSYAQDSVATEAYLGKARKRTSIRRHARLLDYYMHEGCNARTAVCLEVQTASGADGLTLATKTPLLTAENGSSFEVRTTDYARTIVNETVVFETMHPITLRADRNRISLHTWSDFDCCLGKGATSATLRKTGSLSLSAGDLLVFYEAIHPDSLDYRDARKDMRHVVRLTSVTPSRDLHENVDVLEVAWDSKDALPFTLCISKTDDEDAIDDMTLVCANVVFADMGKSAVTSEPPIPETPDEDATYRPTLLSTNITFATDYDSTLSATEILTQSASQAVPQITLTTTSGNLWEPKRDTLKSGAFDRHFVVESEEDRSVRLRFGDNSYGKKPGKGDKFEAWLRTGSGTVGNIGADVLTRVVTNATGVLRVWNALPGLGGIDPEPILDVKRFAPHAFKTQKRAVTAEDYQDLCAKFPGIQGVSVELRWTGSWYTAFIAVDRTDGLSVNGDPEFLTALKTYLDEFRMVGVDLEIRDPKRVPLLVELNVCVKDGWFRANVLKDLMRAFSSGIRPDGERGFFHPDTFTFGLEVYASQIISAAMAVSGVDHVRLTKFQRANFAPSGELAKGVIAIAPQEIAQLTNDRNFPEQGQINFVLEGGM
jgi:hypothetical protein